ncbi:MAG: hypothetical protein PWP04_231 [Candidatus Atribacteria bacterium]|nr:hypothetical protein [Candidatus Atribacteria bacterium]
MEYVRADEKDFRHGDWGIKYLFRGPRVDWGIVYLKPGTSLGKHFHHQVEETFYILEGKGILQVDERELTVEAGTAVRLEPGEKHDLLASSEEAVRGIFIKVPYLPQDKVNC